MKPELDVGTLDTSTVFTVLTIQRSHQCRWGRPVPHAQQERGVPVQAGASVPALALADAKTENFLVSFFEPQCGHADPFQPRDRTKISLSCSHFWQ